MRVAGNEHVVGKLYGRVDSDLSVFVSTSGAIAFDPAKSRIFIRFKVR